MWHTAQVSGRCGVRRTLALAGSARECRDGAYKVTYQNKPSCKLFIRVLWNQENPKVGSQFQAVSPQLNVVAFHRCKNYPLIYANLRELVLREFTRRENLS